MLFTNLDELDMLVWADLIIQETFVADLLLPREDGDTKSRDVVAASGWCYSHVTTVYQVLELNCFCLIRASLTSQFSSPVELVMHRASPEGLSYSVLARFSGLRKYNLINLISNRSSGDNNLVKNSRFSIAKTILKWH